MSRNFVRHGFALLAAVLLLAAVPPAWAQWTIEPAAPEPAAVSVSAAAVEIFPSVGYQRAILTVSRGDEVMTRVFANGERPAIERFDLEGNLLADGVYQWELELIPDAAAARALRLAASENGGEAPGAWQRQTGSFAIVGGTIASPDIAEPGELASEDNGMSFEAPAVPRSGSSGGLDADGAGLSETDVRAAEAYGVAAQPYGTGLQTALASYADGDGNTMAELPSVANSIEAATAVAVPHRSIEPGGTNGRPEKED